MTTKRQKKKNQKKRNHLHTLFSNIAKVVAPPPDLTVGEWADTYRMLSSESSAEPGRFRSDRAPYQKAPLDCLTDPKVKKVVLPWGAQLGKSEIMNNFIGYHIHQDPCPVMMIQPTVDLAKDYSKRRIAPMIRDTPELNEKVSSAKSRDGDNTLLQKSFPGGQLVLVGANSPSGLASRPIRVLIADETDRFPISAGTEGSPIALAEKRLSTFWNKKMLYGSTPTIEGASEIEKHFEQGTQEYYHLDCPNCGEGQYLEWGRLDRETKLYHCAQCGVGSGEAKWKRQLASGYWVARNKEADGSIRSFRINGLFSPWVTWSELIEEYEVAKDDVELLKTFWNTRLSEPFALESYAVPEDELYNRRENYSCDVPLGGLVLTCAVDVQDNRLEYEVKAWGHDKQSWGIRYGAILGDPGLPTVWNELDQLLAGNFIREDGIPLRILTTCIDSGGHHTKTVYEYCRQRESKRVWAIKGQGGPGIPFVSQPKQRNKQGIFLFMLGVDTGKDTVASSLLAPYGSKYYCNFPLEEEKGYNKKYFEGLTSEHRVTEVVNGKSITRWKLKKTSGRNEPLDLHNYNLAAIEILNPNFSQIEEIILQRKKKAAATPGSQAVQQKNKRRGIVNKGISL